MVGLVWAGGISALILLAMRYVPGLHLRVDEAEELNGLDEKELGEFAYDFVEVTREVVAETVPTRDEKINAEVRRIEKLGVEH